MRNYVVDIPGGTATTSVQMQENGTLKQIFFSAIGAIAGSWELSRNPLSQIGTAAPASDVIARLRLLTNGQCVAVFDAAIKVRAFEYLYLHCTGAGNVGELNLTVT
jgi:hypothetical protein